MKDLNYYIKCFSSLHTMKIQEKPAPHKALLILSVIDLVEQGVISDSRIVLNSILEKQFKHNVILYVGNNSAYDPKINYPYYHMQSEPFWELVSTTATPVLDISNYSISNLKKHIAYARIDTELQELLKDSSARVKLRDVLIVNYIDSLDIINKENNMDLASKDINLIEKLNNLLKSCQEYGETYKSLIGQGVSNIDNKFSNIFKTNIPAILRELFPLNTYKIKGSIGQGRITQCPWIAIMNTKETNSTQEGVYLVFLFSKDLQNIYITLAQGVTKSSQDKIIAKRNLIRENLEFDSELLQEYNELKISNPDYNNSAIYSNAWPVNNNNKSLRMINKFKEAYEKYIATKNSYQMTTDAKTPRHWLYAPGEKARKWDECKEKNLLLLGWDPLEDFNQYKSVDEIFEALKDNYDNGNDNSFKNDKLAIWQFMKEMNVGDIVYAKDGINKIIGKGIVEGDYVYDSFREEYKNTRKIRWVNTGDWITDFQLPRKTLTRFEISDKTISRIETLINSKTVTIHQKDFSIREIIDYINETGLLYSDSLIKRFAFSLMAKRFLILSGLAGSGKTQLALAFAKALVEDKEKQMCVVSVGADWTNREPLLGYPNALKSGEYVKPENGVLDLLIEANKPANASKPFFLILDEMNMSYVERYFADFLSAMESHEAIALWKECNNGSESCECNVPERIELPDNLFIIGTINVDETTYMFSPKVLDRANVIEFKISIDEMDKFLDGIGKIDCSSVSSKAAEMGADFVRLANCKEFENEQATTDTLKAFFTELKSVNAEFGYRSATEIFRFISQAHKNDDIAEKMSKEEVLDAAILQKLLPKLHGSRKKLEPALKGLWKLCFEASIKDTMQISRENIEKAIYKESADKILRMYESAYANGFTSFAEA